MSSPATKVQAKGSAPTAPIARKPTAIDPQKVVVDRDGFGSRSMFIRLPEGLTPEDLREDSEIWSGVQRSRGRALRRFDQLLLVAFDETWMATAIVASATGELVHLVGLQVLEIPPRTAGLFSDGTYRVAWDGAGYFVERVADAQRVTPSVPTEALAERDLREMYPRK